MRVSWRIAALLGVNIVLFLAAEIHFYATHQVPRITTQVSRRDQQQAASVEALSDSAQRSKQKHLDLGRLHQSIEQGKAKQRAGRRSTEPHSAQQAAFGSHVSTDAARLLQRINHAAAAWGGGATKLPEGKRAMPDPAVILFCYNRPNYLRQTLDSLSQLAGLERMAVYISQDGDNSAVAAVVQGFAADALAPPQTRAFQHWQHERNPQLGAHQPGHAWLSQHYRWGLDRVFLQHNHSHIIIVEDDMLFSPDFFHFFEATAVLLEADPSLWCISSWNDNGQRTFQWDQHRLFRTSFFPGLGWMMRRELWLELGTQWPQQAWDHWMRLSSTSQGRDCICPEVNRNRNIGEKGVNMDMASFRRYLKTMTFNDKLVADYGNLTELLAGHYQPSAQAHLQQAALLDWSVQSPRSVPSGQTYLLLYTAEQYQQLARHLRAWPFPRGHYRYLTRIPFQGSEFLLADRRFCTLLPIEQREFPHPQLLIRGGRRGQSCASTCSEQGMRCRQDDFWFLNSCEELKRHFPCERGCAAELGPDVPNYVMSEELGTQHMCLVNQRQPLCSASHPSTARLCPCIPSLPVTKMY